MMSKEPPNPTHNFGFTNLGKLDSSRLRWSARKDFNRYINNLRMLGSAEATRLLDANSLEVRSLGAYWKFHTFAAIDFNNLGR